MKAAAGGVLLAPTSPPAAPTTPTVPIRRRYLSVPRRSTAFFERFIVNNGWDLGVWWAKSFYAEVLKCGPRPFALAEATDRCNKGHDGTQHQYSGGLEGSHHTQACGRIRQRYKQQNRARERKWEGGVQKEGITCPTNRSFGHCSNG